MLDAEKFLMLPDLFNYWLTGTKVSEYTNTSTTQILGSDKKWCHEILDELGIPITIFPDLIYPGQTLGPIDKELSDELKLKGNPMIIAPATHDTASAVAGGPLVGEGIAFISSGTWDLVGIELKKPIISEQALRYNFTNEGGAFGTITFLRNMQGMWIAQEIKRLMGELGRNYSYDELTNLAESAYEQSGVIDVDDPRFLVQGDMVSQIKAYLDETKQPVPNSLHGILRVYFKSLALKRRLILERAASVTGNRVRGINVFGGGSKNQLLNQITADESNLNVYAGPDEATAFGNVMVQLAALGGVASIDEMRKILKNSIEIKSYSPREGKGGDDYEKLLSLIGERSPLVLILPIIIGYAYSLVSAFLP
ncbi:MAG: rhamnulokinase [Thermoprotei archaeon]